MQSKRLWYLIAHLDLVLRVASDLILRSEITND